MIAMNPETSQRDIPIKLQRIKISFIAPMLFRDKERIKSPKINPIPTATPAKAITGIDAAKYFKPNKTPIKKITEQNNQ